MFRPLCIVLRRFRASELLRASSRRALRPRAPVTPRVHRGRPPNNARGHIALSSATTVRVDVDDCNRVPFRWMPQRVPRPPTGVRPASWCLPYAVSLPVVLPGRLCSVSSHDMLALSTMQLATCWQQQQQRQRQREWQRSGSGSRRTTAANAERRRHHHLMTPGLLTTLSTTPPCMSM